MTACDGKIIIRKKLSFMEKMRLKTLQKRIIRYENMQTKIKYWLKQDRKEAKKLLNKQ